MSSNADSDINELNKTKLALEIAELARPAWQRPAFTTPVIAAILSLALGYYSGWFEVQSKGLEIKRHDLKEEIKKFESEKSIVATQIKKLTAELDSTKSSQARALNDLANVERKHDAVRKELETSNNELIAARGVQERMTAELSNLERKNKDLLATLGRQYKETEDGIATVRKELRAASARNDRNTMARLGTTLKAMEDSLRLTREEQLRTIARLPDETERDQFLKDLRETGTRLDQDGCIVINEGPAKGEQHCDNL